MKKLLDEIERIKNDPDPLLDKKCIGLYNTTVIFIDDGRKMNLTESYFKEKDSCFDYSYAGCYITPGKETTLRKIHINALKCEIINKQLQEVFERYPGPDFIYYAYYIHDILLDDIK